MQKQWYIVYTRAKCEKKVAHLLAKKKIKNFCPVHTRSINQFNKMKLVYEPLFPSYVFVFLHVNEINAVKQLSNVVNLVYWKGRHAVIQNEEIEEIREFVTHYQDIRLERSRVNLNGRTSFLAERPSYAIDGKILVIKNKFIKVNLPSLGYIMVAAIGETEVMGREIGIGVGNKLLS